jgi:hypothetical protein
MTLTYSTVKAATEPEAMLELLASQVIGPVLPSIDIKKVRTRSGRRFEAPRYLWNVYEATLEVPGGAEMKPLFWTRTFFDDADCEKYRQRISWLLNGKNGNPLDPAGYAKFVPEMNLFLFFFPADPVFPRLPMFYPPDNALPVLTPHFNHLRPGASIKSVSAERVKYLPEISCILRISADVGEEKPLSIYGKFQHSKRGAFTYDVMRTLWELPARQSGELVLAEPLAYLPEYDLLLQSELPGEEIEGDRHSDVFLAQCEAAGKALACIHESGIAVGKPHTVDVEIGRLQDRLDEFKMSGPRVFFALRDLLKQVTARAARVAPEAPVASHGDFKYNQFLFDGERFGLIDVEYFVQAEPSFDLGKYCGHLAPSQPKDWSDTAAANDARRVFLDAYSSMRPQYRGSRFAIYEALSLATRALVVMWSAPRNWEHIAETLVALAYERLKTPWGE